MMTWMGKKNPLKHLGTLHGRGSLWPAAAAEGLGPVTYEIDGYQQRERRTGSGRLEGDPAVLARAFAAPPVRLRLEKGGSLAITLSDPEDESIAEFVLDEDFPG